MMKTRMKPLYRGLLIALLTVLLCIPLGIWALAEAPVMITADDLEWVDPDGTITKVYDGTDEYPEAVSVQIKAGVVGANAIPIQGRYYFSSANVGEGNLLIFDCDQQYVAGSYIIPAGIRLTREASITPQPNFSRTVEWSRPDDTEYNGEYFPEPVIIASNGAAREDMTFTWKLSGTDTVVDTPFKAGEYDLYVTVPDTPNGLGARDVDVSVVTIRKASIHLDIPESVYLVDRTLFGVEEICTMIERRNQPLLIAGDTLGVSLNHVEGCRYTVDFQIYRGDDNVTDSYQGWYGSNEIDVHLGSVWNGSFCCSTCYQAFAVDYSNISGTAAMKPDGNMLENVESFSDFVYVVQSASEELAAEIHSQSRNDLFLQCLVSDRKLTVDQLRSRTDWKDAEQRESYALNETSPNYLYFRWVTLSGVVGEYQTLPIRFIRDQKTPVITPKFEANSIYIGAIPVSITDECGIYYIQMEWSSYGADGALIERRRENIYHHNMEDELLTSYSFTLPEVTGEVSNVTWSIMVADHSGRMETAQTVYESYTVASVMKRLISEEMTLQTVTAYDLSTVQSAREKLMRVKGVRSEGVQAEYDKALAQLDEMLAVCVEKRQAEEEFKQASNDAEAALEEADVALAEADAANKAALEEADIALREELEADMSASDKSNKILGIVGLVFGTVSFAGVAALSVYVVILKKKKS